MMLSNPCISLQNYSYPAKKLQKNQNGTRQVVLNLILFEKLYTNWLGVNIGALNGRTVFPEIASVL